MKGWFITFEGPDGAGKTTQLQRIANILQEEQKNIVVTREPGGTLISDQIRKIILDPIYLEMKAETEILLYAASRAQHVLEKIKPALQSGAIVLCDRFVDASIAYQGYGLGFGEDVVKQINHIATGGLVPDRTYLIDLSPEEGRTRLNLRNRNEFEQELDRIEQKKLEYHHKVRTGFHQLAKKENRILLIDGQQTVEQIHQIILKDIRELLTRQSS